MDSSAPATQWCPDCAAFLPLAAFRVRQERRKDGSIYYYPDRYCREHTRTRYRAWYEGRHPDLVRRRAERAAQQRALQDEAQQAAARAEDHARRKAACIAFVQRYVAGLWEQEPAWLRGRGRDPDRVEARALVTAILHREHGIGITETARCIGRDHSTALHLLAKFEPQPEFQELLADYRDMRARRKAARAQRAS
jgi:hypothetical protein